MEIESTVVNRTVVEYTIPRYRRTRDRTGTQTKVGWLVSTWNQFVNRLGPTLKDLSSQGIVGPEESEEVLKMVTKLGEKVSSLETRSDLNQTSLDEVSHPERISLTRTRRDLTNSFPTHVHQVHQMYGLVDHLWGMGEISREERDRLLDRINGYDRLLRGMIGTLEKLRYESS